MYGNEQQGFGHYQQSDLAIQAAAANPHQLVLMLFNGLMDELVRAKSHIAARRFDRKVQSINKCIDILNALTSSLDFEKGGELALSPPTFTTTACIGFTMPATSSPSQASKKWR